MREARESAEDRYMNNTTATTTPHKLILAGRPATEYKAPLIITTPMTQAELFSRMDAA